MSKPDTDIKKIMAEMVKKEKERGNISTRSNKVMISKQYAKMIEQHLGYLPGYFKIIPLKPSIKKLMEE